MYKCIYLVLTCNLISLTWLDLALIQRYINSSINNIKVLINTKKIKDKAITRQSEEVVTQDTCFFLVTIFCQPLLIPDISFFKNYICISVQLAVPVWYQLNRDSLYKLCYKTFFRAKICSNANNTVRIIFDKIDILHLLIKIPIQRNKR